MIDTGLNVEVGASKFSDTVIATGKKNGMTGQFKDGNLVKLVPGFKAQLLDWILWIPEKEYEIKIVRDYDSLKFGEFSDREDY